jgi:hypothetical protein
MRVVGRNPQSAIKSSGGRAKSEIFNPESEIRRGWAGEICNFQSVIFNIARAQPATRNQTTAACSRE